MGLTIFIGLLISVILDRVRVFRKAHRALHAFESIDAAEVLADQLTATVECIMLLVSLLFV